MQFKGRTVVIIMVLSVCVSCVITLAFRDKIPHILQISSSESSISQTANTSVDTPVSSAAKSSLREQDLKKIENIYHLIEKKFIQEIDHDKLVSGAINGMLEALEDPYTVYMDEKESKQFSESISSSFEGIGAEVSIEGGKVIVVSPIKGSPAEKAGIQSNDIVLSVNGEKLEGLTLGQAALKIRGAKGTQAKLELIRNGYVNPIFVVVVRDEIDVETVYASMLEQGIGKIEIRQFSSNTAVDFKNELVKLEENGLKGLIIDVRNNPGGLLNIVVEIAEQFVPNGKPIVQVENRYGTREPTLSKGNTKNYPVTILINKGSASASEILAGALEETIGSQLVGETTYGKGTVQVTFENELGDGSNLKMTAYKWLTPSGNWINKTGIKPTIAVSQPSYFKSAMFSKESTLMPDTTHEEVKNLQVMLKGLGYELDREDGYYSETTVEAVRMFQKKHGLNTSGEVDVPTANQLEKLLLQEIRNPKNDAQLLAAIESILIEMKSP